MSGARRCRRRRGLSTRRSISSWENCFREKKLQRRNNGDEDTHTVCGGWSDSVRPWFGPSSAGLSGAGGRGGPTGCPQPPTASPECRRPGTTHRHRSRGARPADRTSPCLCTTPAQRASRNRSIPGTPGASLWMRQHGRHSRAMPLSAIRGHRPGSPRRAGRLA